MNKVYKVVWNASIGIWVAVSEIAKGNTKSKSKTVTVGSVVVAIIGAVTFSPNAMGETGISGGTGSGTAISSSTGTSGGGSGATYCGTGSTQAFTGTGTRTIAIGCDARAEGTNSVIADRSNPYNTTAINPRVTYGTSSAANLAIGTGAFSGGNYTDVNGTTQTVSQATAIGSWATAQHIAAIAIGSASLATGNTSLAVGRQSVASGDYAQALGNVSAATGTGSLAIGHSATATGYRGIAIGAPDIATAAVVAGQQGAAYQTVGYTLASGKDSIAFGGGAQATQENALSIGAFSKATGTKSVAIGTGAEATAASALVIGENAKTAVAGGVALGMDAQVVGENSAAVGKGSIAVAQSGSSFLTNVAPSATNGVVSVGTTGTTRRIQNVADGAADQDAVTVAQLTRVNDRAVGNTTALGGGAAYDPQTKAYTAPTFTTTKTDGTTVNASTVAGALTNLNNEVVKPITFSGNTGSSANKLGSTLNITGTGSTAGTYSGNNLKTSVSGNTVSIQMADAPNFAGTVTSTGQQVNGNSVITGTSTIGSGANAVTLSGTANGLDVGNKKISNLAAPSAGSDATNKTYVDGKVQTLGDTPLGFIGDSGTKATRKLGEDLNVKGGATGTLTNGNIGVVSNGTNQLDIKLAETVNLGANGSVTTGSTVVSNIGVTTPQVVIGTGANTTTLTSNGTSLNVGGDKITNVADGSVASDAVNKGQLDIVSTQANKAITFTGNARKSGDTTDINRKLGDSIAISGTATTTGTYSGSNVKTVTDQAGSISIQIADAPNFAGTVTSTGQQVNGNSVITGTSTIGSGANAVTLSGTANGLDVGNKKISNLAAPSAGSDATNKTYVDGKVQTLADTPLGFIGDSGTKATRKLGEDLNVKGGATGTLTNGNIGVVSNGTNQLDIKLAETVNLGANGSVTTGSTVVSNIGVTTPQVVIGTGANTTTLTSNGTSLNVGGDKITNVGNATTASDAVNKGQLDSSLANANSNAAVVYTDAAGDKVTKAADGKWYAATDVNADGSLIGSPSEVAAANIITSVQNANGSTTTATKLSNVAAGSVTASSTDAINGSQLYNTANNVKNLIGGTTTIDANTGVITTSNIGGTGSSTIDGAITEVSKSAKAAKTTVTAGENVEVTSTVDSIDGHTNYIVKTAKDVSFDKVTVGNVVIDKSTNTISGLSNKDLTAADFATQGRAATEEQLKQVISSNITEVVDGNGNKVNIIDQVVNTKPDNKNQDSLFLTYDKQGQETTDRLTIAQTVQKMNTEGVKFFHTNADTSKGDLGTTNDSSAGGLNSTAVGVNAIVETDAVSALAVGHNTKAGGAQSIAIGNGAEALGTQSISIGTGNKVTGDHSGAIGDPTIVDGSNSYSVGNNNQVLTDDTFVLGNNVTQTVPGSVVLGTGSAATTGAGVAGYALSTATTADKTAISNTTSRTGAVAIGDAANGIYRQITGVAAGSQDSDAVNVAQLKAVGNQVTTTQTSLVNSLGGNAKVNADGSITGPTYNVAQGTQTNVGDALTALDQAIGNAATTSKTTVSNGENIVVSKTKNADGSDNYQVSTAKDLTVDSIKAGETVLNNAGIAIANNAVVLNNTGLVIAGGPSVTTQEINAGNKQVTNVAAGTNATDAVNKGQLDSAINNVNNNVNQLANNAVKYDDATKDKITLGGANGTTISNVKDGTVAQGSKEAVNGGQLWNVQQQVNQNTSDIENIQTNINNINNGKSGLVQQQTPNGDITIGKDTGGTKVSVAGKDGDRVVTGVKDGGISATSKDAVNGSQLNVTNNKVVEFLGGGAGYDNITNSFTNPTYTVGGKEYNNVGGAVDALNKADQALDSKIDNVSNRLEQAFYSTNQRIDDVEKRANAGIAAAMALEAAPFVAGKYTYAAGASYHGGENAVGVTLRKTADNGRWSITGGVAAASQGDPSVRIGISGVID